MSERQIHTAPADSVEPILGRTLASLLDDACALNLSTPAVAEMTPSGEYSLKARELREQADQLAVALLDSGISRGDRVVLCMPPGVAFTTIDFACQISGIIDVPLYETCRVEDLAFILDETQATAIFLGGDEASKKAAQVLKERMSLKIIIDTDRNATSASDHGAVHAKSMLLQELIEKGNTLLSANPQLPTELRAKIGAHDIATLIYTSGTTGQPKGVQLTQENVSFNGMTGFADIHDLREDEVAMSLLPLAHVFQRTMHYAVISKGWPIYFTKPTELKEGLQWSRPTMFASVPRVLEKIREGIELAGSQRSGLQRKIFDWAMALAEQQEIGRVPGTMEKAKLAIADKLVYTKWRKAVGGRLRTIVCGGAALNPRIANFFSAWKIDVLQGFGLTETSTIVTFNRRRLNRAGTAGHPLPGVEVTIAEDGEILTRGPHVTSGYFNRPDATAEAIDQQGWFHTGDIGEFDEDGFLKITDRKKNLFKLSTGRYIAPQPMEVILTSEPIINHALITGVGQKFAIALLFPEEISLNNWARDQKINVGTTLEELIKHPLVQKKYRQLLDTANATVPDFHKAKRFLLINAELNVENGLLTPTMKIRRSATSSRFAAEIERLYTDAAHEDGSNDMDL